MSIENIINEAWEKRDQVNQDSDQNLKEKKYLLLDLDGVCYGKHNNYSLEKVFGQVSKRMTQFISDRLKLDKDKAK